MRHKNVHRSTSSFPVKCPGSSYTSCPLFILSRTEIPEGPLTFEHYIKIAAPEVIVTVRLLIGGWEGWHFDSEHKKKSIHHRASVFAHICKKFHLMQGLKLCFPLFGKAPLKRSHFSKVLGFTLFLNISCEALDWKVKAIHPFKFSF